jgi:hypothetical protein
MEAETKSAASVISPAAVATVACRTRACFDGGGAPRVKVSDRDWE